MARPNFVDLEVRAAYRRELRQLYRGWRWFGLALVLLAAWLLVWPRMGGPWTLGPLPTQRWGFGLMVVAWTSLGSIIVLRTRYHVRRINKPEP
jgi:hypothetical protein